MPEFFRANMKCAEDINKIMFLIKRRITDCRVVEIV